MIEEPLVTPIISEIKDFLEKTIYEEKVIPAEKLKNSISAKYTFVGEGQARMVFKDPTDKIVIKINKSYMGGGYLYYSQGNEAEYTNFCRIRDRVPCILSYVANPLSYYQLGSTYVSIFPYYPVVPLVPHKRSVEYRIRLRKIKKIFNDAHYKNVGITPEGMPILIDIDHAPWYYNTHDLPVVKTPTSWNGVKI